MVPDTSAELDSDLSFPHGNAFGGLHFGPYVYPDGSNPPNALSRVVMQFRTNLLDETLASVLQTITSDSASQITISTAATWEGDVLAQQLDKLPVGTHWWAMEFRDSAGLLYPLAQGRITVTPRPVLPT